MRILQEPVLGLRYEVSRVHFDPLPEGVRTLCGAFLANENVVAHSWLYATARGPARTYFVVGGYFEDRHPAPGYPRYERDERGLIVYVQGRQCKAIDSAREVFDDRIFDEISQPELRQLAFDLAARLSRAFGGETQLRTELRNQHVDLGDLPVELREAFAPYLEQ